MILNNEYPAPKPTKRNILVAFLFGSFISFFLIFFEPFEIDVSTGRMTVLYLIFLGFITTIVLIIFLYLLPLTLPKIFAERNWKVKHQMIFCSTILFVIATLNGLYTNYVNSLSFSWSNYWWIINRSFVLGSIPFSFLILIDYRRRDAANKETARSFHTIKSSNNETLKAGVFSIITDLKNEVFTYEDSHFTYAMAVGNYTDLFFYRDGKSTCKTYRILLSTFEKQLNLVNLQRCHRSYLVNLNKVIHVSGNAQGLKLTMANGGSEVPVSRRYISVIKKFFSDQS